MTVSRTEASNAMLELSGGAEKIAAGIPQHILDNPGLDYETLHILEMVATVMPLLCSVTRQAFLKALDAEDALDQIKAYLDDIEEK